jgi:hypothetical protein
LSRDVAVLGRGTTVGASALLAALVGRPVVADAAPGGAHEGAELLRWRAPVVGCPDEATVRARLAQALGPEVEAPRVEAEVSAGDDGRFHAVVSIQGAWGETTRRLDSPTCDTLADAVVLLAAVSVGLAAREPEPPLAVPEPTTLPPDVGVEQALTEVHADGEADEGVRAQLDATADVGGDDPASIAAGPAPRAPRGAGDAGSPPPVAPALRGLVRVEARAGAGLLPVVDLGAAAVLGLEHRWFRVELAGAAWLPRERTVVPDARVRASAWALELRGCAALRPSARLVVLPCAELVAGQLRGEGHGDGLVNGRNAQQPWVALGLGPAVSLRLHRRVGLWAGATLIVPVRRVGLGLEGLPTDAHRMAAVAGRGALGVEIYFP